MYQVARSWAPDAQVLKMNSILMTEVKDVPPGTAGAWQATFTSAARSQARSYTYSIIEGEGNLHRGVFAGLEEGWSGPRSGNTPFLMLAVKDRHRRGVQDGARATAAPNTTRRIQASRSRFCWRKSPNIPTPCGA